MKFAHLIFCGLAALALPVAAQVKDEPPLPEPASATAVATLFPGAIDMPVAHGSAVPDDCAFPASLQSANTELACVVATNGAGENEVGIEYISWLGENGWRHSANVEGGIVAARRDADGCEQMLGVYPHGEDGEATGIWFALVREPACAAPRPATETP